jgi:hypothetical protein
VSTTEATQNAETIGIVGGILLLLVLAVAYYAGGYVAGRLARFDGARQGAGVWVLGLLITIALAVVGAVLARSTTCSASSTCPASPSTRAR